MYGKYGLLCPCTLVLLCLNFNSNLLINLIGVVLFENKAKKGSLRVCKTPQESFLIHKYSVTFNLMEGGG